MKFAKTFIPLSLVAILASCGAGNGNNYKIPSTDNTLVVDLHTFMPSGSESSADLVSITKTQKIADDFYEKTGIRIKWFTGKSLDGEADSVSGDYIKAIQNGKMPAIGFSWSAFKDRGYYMSIDKYLDTPNEFLSAEEQAKYPTWKSQFPSYLWDTKECSGADGSIVALPLFLNPGPATGWYYNKNLMQQNSLDVPITWNEFRNLAQEVKNISDDAGPYVYNQTQRIDNWEFQFSIGPAFGELMNNKDICDTNGDGKLSEQEVLDGVLAGKYSPLKEENPNYYQYAQAAYQILKDYYKTMLPDGWQTANAEEAWSKGKAVLRQNGLWSIRAENGLDNTRGWKYGIFASPVVSNDSATWLGSKNLPVAASALKKVSTVTVPEKQEGQYTPTELGNAFVDAYKPTASLYVNLMKHGIYDNEKVLENAVKFLKFMSVPKNISTVCQEHQAILGGVYGSTPGALLSDWLQQEFPVVPSSYWPNAYTVTHNNNINKKLKTWVKGETSDAEFFSLVASEQKAGAQEYKTGINN